MTDRTAPAPPAPASTALTHRQIMVVLSGLGLGLLLAALDQTIVSTALPTIVGELGGIDHLSWVVTAYLLASTASTPLYGKLGDLYGRKIVFQVAIVIFLVASALAGLSQNLTQLIAFRGLQGLGGGGLITGALAILGDVVPPRQRGRYQGYFGAVFGLASILGPLLGGFFVDQLSWRWIFYVNIPLGIVALVVTSSVLKMPFARREHKVDYLGAALLVAGVSSILLVTVWGGQQYPWASPTIVGLAAAGVALVGLFVWREHTAPEPILPLRLFRNDVFSVTCLLAFFVGFAMFGAIVFLPVYLQVAKGVSPTASGLLLLPLMGGLILTSITSGRLISRIGHYKPFPIIGTALLTIGLALHTQLAAGTSQWVVSSYMFVVGLGLGCVMQTLVLAVQNAVPIAELGVATSSNAFFRSMGGAFGTAIFGAVLSSRLAVELPRNLPPGAADRIPAGRLIGSPQAIKALPPAIHDGVVTSIVNAIDVVFWVAVPVTAVAFVLSLFLREVKLRDTAGVGTDGPPSPTAAATGAPSVPVPAAANGGASRREPAPAGASRSADS